MQVPVTSLSKRAKVEWIDFYSVQVMHASIVDDEGQGTQICFDCRANSPTRHRLFQQARHPNLPGAVLVELGSEEEGIIVPLLSRYLDTHGPKASGLTEDGWELAREILLLLGTADGSEAPEPKNV